MHSCSKKSAVIMHGNVHPRINWPAGGTNSAFLILNIPCITDDMIEKMLTFICSNFYFLLKGNIQRFVTVPGIQRHERNQKPMQLEHFFVEAVDPTCNPGIKCIDYYRFQSAPEHSVMLMEHPTIRNAVRLVEDIVNKQLVERANICSISSSYYCVTKVGILLSRPGGAPQMLHIDDMRDSVAREEEGESLSVVLALQDGTLLDFDNGKGKRLTYSIPSTSMFLFSGTCYHGGSSYNRYNVRLHMYLFPRKSTTASDGIENVIIVRKPCPVKGCQHVKEGETFHEQSLYYHWNKYHIKDIGLSVGKYIDRLNDKQILQCTLCRKGFNNARCLTRHRHKCRGRKLGKKL